MDPFAQFSTWLNEAKSHAGIKEPTAMSLATVGEGGKPSVRMVLLKGYDARGFVFYTNTNSRKGHELLANPNVALCFHWMPLLKQVRIEGIAKRVSDEEADEYFKSRPRESQLSAWASQQSEPLASMDILAKEMQRLNELYTKDVPRPPYWSGFRVMPSAIEFWQQGDARLHKRELYVREGGWKMTGLYP